MSGAFARLLEVSNKQLVLTKISAILVIVNILLNILLIPIFSYVGASIVTVITELLSFLLCIIVVSKMHYGLSRYELMSIMKIGAASIIMGLFIISFEYIDLILLIVSSVIIYFITLYIFKIFDNSDLKIFRKLINRAGIE
jgi:O-antigen/teichoic acid export membrane protein